MEALQTYKMSGIEWAYDERFHFGQKMAKHLEDFIDSYKTLPIKEVEILFSSDEWDFNACFKLRSSDAFKFTFGSIPEEFKRPVKFFVLMTLMNSDNKVTTVNRRYRDIVHFTIYLYNSGVHDLRQITNKDIKTYMDKFIKNHSPKTSSMVRFALQMFFEFVFANYSYDMHMDLSVLKNYDYLVALEEKMREANKTPDIPEEYYDELLSVLIQVMRDKNAKYNFRITACLYVILTQTGLRITEIHALTTDSLKSIIVKGIATGYYLEVHEFKPASRYEEALSFTTFANALTVEAVTTLKELRETSSRKEGNNFLYLPLRGSIPAEPRISRNIFHQLIWEYMPSCRLEEDEDCPYEELNKVWVINNNPDRRFVMTPHTKQFRVHLCTELYFKHHVSLLFIQKFMGHLSEAMQGYYVRDNREVNIEEISATEELLSDIVQDKVELLGGRSKEINENIDKFIAEGNYNISEDLDKIVKDLDGALAIRVKRGGFCVKASMFRECSQDAQTNEIYCAYNICPNLCHVYYMAVDSYKDFKTLQRTFEINIQNGFELQASRELQKLKAVLRTRLVPELESMTRRINNFGLEKVLTDYPQLKDIVDNYDSIQEEIEKWQKMKY